MATEAVLERTQEEITDGLRMSWSYVGRIHFEPNPRSGERILVAFMIFNGASEFETIEIRPDLESILRAHGVETPPKEFIARIGAFANEAVGEDGGALEYIEWVRRHPFLYDDFHRADLTAHPSP